jgi:hypothetical protein
MYRLAIAACLIIIGSLSVQGAIVTHLYTLNDTYTDAYGGSSLIPAGGTLGAGAYSFDAGQGLSLSNALLNPASYTIEMSIQFTNTSGYRKIIDLNNLTSDSGLYNFSGRLDFYSLTNSINQSISQGTYAHLVLTRDASGILAGYIDGIQQFSVLDSLSYGVFDQPNNIIQFFKDDAVTGGVEVSAGSVDWIQIYDSALNADTVARLPNTEPSVIPEPTTIAIWSILALLGIAIGWRRRSRAS